VSATADEYRSAAPETEGPREPRTLAGPVAASAGTPACDCLAGTALHNDDVCAWRLRGRDCVPSPRRVDRNAALHRSSQPRRAARPSSRPLWFSL